VRSGRGDSVTLGALDASDHHLAAVQGGAAGQWLWGLDVEEDEEQQQRPTAGAHLRSDAGATGRAGASGAGRGGLSDFVFGSLNYGTNASTSGADAAVAEARSTSPRRFV
jgi:hypothetical protein